MRPTRQMFPGQLFVVLSSLAMIAGSPVHSSEKPNEREAARRPADCLARILHAQPMYASGRLPGVRLFPNDPPTRQWFASLELRAGDIYDGGGRTPQEEFSRLEAAVMGSDQDPVRLILIRGDRTVELKIPAARIKELIEYCHQPG